MQIKKMKKKERLQFVKDCCEYYNIDELCYNIDDLNEMDFKNEREGIDDVYDLFLKEFHLNKVKYFEFMQYEFKEKLAELFTNSISAEQLSISIDKLIDNLTILQKIANNCN